MTYELAIADRTYSSWSLRGWLLFEKFNIPVKTHTAVMYTDGFREMLEDFKPARLVPAMKTAAGHVVTDTLAMAETLNEDFPDRGMWPADPAARALARSLTAEMHSGFGALRDACTMNLRHAYEGFEPSEAVKTDVARLEMLWSMARRQFGSDGPWLFGEYSIADAFFAPVATRLATYGLKISAETHAYVQAHISDGVFRRWRAMGIAENYVQPGYDLDLPTARWPGPELLAAKATDEGTAENAACPYSGKPVEWLLELNGRTFGFCNKFCRDKTVADPEAWPAFMEIYQK